MPGERLRRLYSYEKTKVEQLTFLEMPQHHQQMDLLLLAAYQLFSKKSKFALYQA